MVPWRPTSSTSGQSTTLESSSRSTSTSWRAPGATSQPSADDENDYLDAHSWEEYADWHLGLTEGASDETKARYGFVYGDFRRVHRMGLIACQYRAAEWSHKEIELAAHDLLQFLDRPGDSGAAWTSTPAPGCCTG